MLGRPTRDDGQARHELHDNPHARTGVTGDRQQSGARGRCLSRTGGGIITAAQTYELRRNFNWNSVQPVAEKDAVTHALLWVYIRNKADHLALKKLFIHELSRPLFTEELDSMAGKCGSFINPGDGSGYMVPVVMLGKTYNKLKEVQSRNDISDDKVLFDAVILRTVPSDVRNPNGSIKLDALKKAAFVYLPYEKRPLPASANVTLDGGVSKTLFNAVAWVAQEVKDATERIPSRTFWRTSIGRSAARPR